MWLIPLILELGVVEDEQVFLQIYNKYREPVFFFINKMTNNREAAEDINQEVFIKLLAYQNDFHDELKTKNILYKIALNLCRDRGRRLKVRKHLSFDAMEEVGIPLSDEKSNFEDNFEDNQLVSQIKGIIDSLPDEIREVVYMKKIQSMKYNDISKITGQSERTIRRKISSGIELMIEELKKLGIVREGILP